MPVRVTNSSVANEIATGMDIRPIIIGSVGGVDSAYALDCGWQRLVAFANHCCISVVDLNNRLVIPPFGAVTADPGIAEPTEELLSEIDEIPMENPTQILFHGFRKQHIILVYPREVVFFDMVLCQPVGSIRLEQSSASFMRVYACRQADMLICLHVTGAITVHLGVTPPTPGPNLDTVNCDLRYTKVGESKSLRRGRNFLRNHRNFVCVCKVSTLAHHRVLPCALSAQPTFYYLFQCPPVISRSSL
ncbi:unnamed protein product [Dibothriocephalus latus]|uniref:Uncharacterized protein n=1 Tax=Dibothriocephalus latus TaxID=60516 RepID=A0A3P7NYC7_DIBLA|nr:unnamed protein product [Dibothriocephalus latus]